MIGILHLLLNISYLIYYMYAPYKYDKYIFIFLLFIFLHWICMNGECIITYIYKICNDKNYKKGDNVTELDDFVDLSKSIQSKINVNYKHVYNTIILFIYLTVFLLVYRFIKHRTIKPLILLYINIILVTLYLYNLRTHKNNIFNQIYSVILLTSIYIVYKNKKYK